MENPVPQTIVEEFTLAVWRAAGLGRSTILEIVVRYFEEQAVMQSLADRRRVNPPAAKAASAAKS